MLTKQLDAKLSARLGVPVLDSVGSAVKVLEALVDMNLRTSYAMSYGPVVPQEYKNVPEAFHTLYEETDLSQK